MTSIIVGAVLMIISTWYQGDKNPTKGSGKVNIKITYKKIE